MFKKKFGKIFKKSLIFIPKLFYKKEFYKSEFVLWLLLFTFILNAVNWVAPFFFIRPIDRDIILHYNVYFGVDNVGNGKLFFVFPFIGFFLFLLNYFLADFFYRHKERIAAYILLIAAFLVQIALLIASLSIIIINY